MAFKIKITCGRDSTSTRPLYWLHDSQWVGKGGAEFDTKQDAEDAIEQGLGDLPDDAARYAKPEVVGA